MSDWEYDERRRQIDADKSLQLHDQATQRRQVGEDEWRAEESRRRNSGDFGQQAATAPALPSLSTFIFVAIAICLVATIVVPITWWQDGHTWLRPLLEGLPLPVADTRQGSGNPIAVTIVWLVIVIAAIVGLTVTRRQLIERFLYGELGYPVLLVFSVLADGDHHRRPHADPDHRRNRRRRRPAPSR